MVLLARETVPISSKDLVSYIFDDLKYNEDEPVSLQANLTQPEPN